MYLHKENRELFRDAILLTSQKLEVSEDIVEKDYYVTMILKKLSVSQYPVVFKGGTSLSKAFHVIDRFSEDIDITFTEHLGEAKRKKLKYDILKSIADELDLEIRNFKSIESDKNLNHYDFYYESVVGDRVILEAFPLKVQSLNRTLIDKMFAVCDYYIQGKSHRNARHLYDIYKLSEYITIDDKFLNLVEEVRNHRIGMGTNIAPAAPLNINIMELVHKICNEDFYKNDYKETTIKLISDFLAYEEVKDHYKNLAEKIFNRIE